MNIPFPIVAVLLALAALFLITIIALTVNRGGDATPKYLSGKKHIAPVKQEESGTHILPQLPGNLNKLPLEERLILQAKYGINMSVPAYDPVYKHKDDEYYD